MQFKLTTILATALSVSAVNAISADEIVDNIKKVTDLSSDANDIFGRLKGPTSVLSVAPQALDSFTDIISTVTKASGMLSDAKGETIDSKDAQQEVCNAFTGFVKVHQDLLNTVIGKEGLLSSTPFTAPIAAVLRQIEGGVDTFAFSLIGLVPSCADDAEMEKMKLDDTLDEAIQTYSP